MLKALRFKTQKFKEEPFSRNTIFFIEITINLRISVHDRIDNKLKCKKEKSRQN